MLPKFPHFETNKSPAEDHRVTIEKRRLLCNKFGFEADVYGEMYFDHGCQNYIATFTCKNCKNLFEHLISKMTWADIESPIEYYNQKKHQTTKKKPNDAYQESICQKAA